MNIYITSFFRFQFLQETIDRIIERTAPGSYSLHIFDNGSDPETQDKLVQLLKSKTIASLHMDSRNTGCLYNKLIFHAMTETSEKYYIVTDNDVYPPKVDPDWLSQMIAIMDNHPELAFLALQLPPVSLQEPYQKESDIVYCKAVGNTFKLVRREAIKLDGIKQEIGAFGDDGLFSDNVQRDGWKVAFCRNIFCWHSGQCTDWGYKKEEIALDKRKVGYGKPYIYEPKNMDTYEPPDHLKA